MATACKTAEGTRKGKASHELSWKVKLVRAGSSSKHSTLGPLKNNEYLVRRISRRPAHPRDHTNEGNTSVIWRPSRGSRDMTIVRMTRGGVVA